MRTIDKLVAAIKSRLPKYAAEAYEEEAREAAVAVYAAAEGLLGEGKRIPADATLADLAFRHFNEKGPHQYVRPIADALRRSVGRVNKRSALVTARDVYWFLVVEEKVDPTKITPQAKLGQDLGLPNQDDMEHSQSLGYIIGCYFDMPDSAEKQLTPETTVAELAVMVHKYCDGE